VREVVEAVWRMEAAKIVATLTRAVGDVGFAEDLAQEALVDALTQWPSTGVPRNTAAWLTAVAKRKAIDVWRRQDRLDERYAAMARELEMSLAQDDSHCDPDRIDDDVLRLIFVAAHPAVPAEGRIALTLRVVGGLTTEEIARAFLVSTATVAQRIVRAKKTLAKANVPFEVPDRSEYPQRLSSVLSVIYLHGLVALMEFQSSRFAARTAPDDTDWATIVRLYEALGRVTPSPVVELNRAIAVSMASGPAEALQIVDSLTGLDGSYLWPSVRGELLARLGRHAEAAREFEAAATLTGNERERDVLLNKATRSRTAG
jgi:RNA polymerase sigma factor (sigma-70 family)